MRRAGNVRRAAQLLAGVSVMGLAVALFKLAGLGLGPWDVLHDGIARHTGVDLGIVSIVVGAAVLLVWIPLRQRPGVGTIANVFVVGAVAHQVLSATSPAHTLAARVGELIAGLALFAIGQGLYLSTDLGPGPRDGVMTGMHRRLGISLRLSRTMIEVTALAVGVMMGGSFGIGTVVFAFAIGPMVQETLRWFGYAGVDRDVIGDGDGVLDAVGLTGE